MRSELSAPFLERLYGKRQSFSRESVSEPTMQPSLSSLKLAQRTVGALPEAVLGAGALRGPGERPTLPTRVE